MELAPGTIRLHLPTGQLGVHPTQVHAAIGLADILVAAVHNWVRWSAL